MAKRQTEEFLVANNGCKASFRKPGYEKGEVLRLTDNWPLDEFHELAEFVREYQRSQYYSDQVDMKTPELEDSSEEPQTDG